MTISPGEREWNLNVRLHQLLFEIKEDLREPWLLFRKHEDSFVDDLESERSFDRFAVRVGDMKADVRIGTRQIAGTVGMRFDMQILCRLHKDESMILHRLRIRPEDIGVELNGPGE